MNENIYIQIDTEKIVYNVDNDLLVKNHLATDFPLA